MWSKWNGCSLWTVCAHELYRSSSISIYVMIFHLSVGPFDINNRLQDTRHTRIATSSLSSLSLSLGTMSPCRSLLDFLFYVSSCRQWLASIWSLVSSSLIFASVWSESYVHRPRSDNFNMKQKRILISFISKCARMPDCHAKMTKSTDFLLAIACFIIVTQFAVWCMLNFIKFSASPKAEATSERD